MRMLTACATLAALSFATSAVAQQPQPAGVTRHHFSATEPERAAPVQSAPTDEPTKMLARTLAGSLGLVGGATLGVAIARARGPHQCGCEFQGLDQTLTGIAIGGIIGAGVGAAIPWFDSNCSTGSRLARALAGSALGFAAGLPFFPFGPLIVAPVGSGLALLGC